MTCSVLGSSSPVSANVDREWKEIGEDNVMEGMADPKKDERVGGKSEILGFQNSLKSFQGFLQIIDSLADILQFLGIECFFLLLQLLSIGVHEIFHDLLNI